MSNAKFIAIEGLDWSGKDTVSEIAYRRMQQMLGKDAVVLTGEPWDAGAYGDLIRNVLSGRRLVTSAQLAAYMAVNRADHVDELLSPALQDTSVRLIISVRYLPSSLVYNVGETVSRDTIMELNRGVPKPDATLYIDVDPRECDRRMTAAGVVREKYESLDDLITAKDRYLDALRYLHDEHEWKWQLIDGNQEIELVVSAIVSAVWSLLNQNGNHS